VLNLQTGKEITMGVDRRDHDHGDPDGARRHHDHHHDRDHAHGAHDRHAHGHDHDHSHPRDHDHADDASHRGRHSGAAAAAGLVELEAQILDKNDRLAARNRAWFRGREILALNLVSSPGAGKTTLLERTIRDLGGALKIFVVEGDQATSNDGERIRAAGAPAVQVNTGAGCHLEADMVARGVQELKPTAGSVVMIENVGNLVCPALFDLGERAKVLILSVAEGEDKPLKYPHMFRAAEVMILNKIDLLPHVDFDPARAIANARRVNPDIAVIPLSARTGEGLAAWYEWLRRECGAVADAAFA
jgi:hydrogenase nickel incorporation protein HypB